MSSVRIWDLPIRLFHWLFAVACATAWVSGNDPRYTDPHLFAGYLALGLVLFRLVWGVVGGRYARFGQFVRGPAAVLDHLSRLFGAARNHEPGHNPAGAWAILAMLGLVLLLALTGLVVLGGEEGFGPLAGVFSIAQGVAVHRWHDWLAWALLGVVVLHLAGVALESVLQRQNLPRSMITGCKEAAEREAEPRNYNAVGGLLAAVVVVSAGGYFLPYLRSTPETPYLPFVGAELQHSGLWQESCSECHLAYHPSLLPSRSWERLFATQEDHFGEDLVLDAELVDALLAFARANSAEQVQREAAWRTLQSLGANESPLRITDTAYWKRVHRHIDEAIWKRPSVNGKYNCATCHKDARQGGYMNGAMRLPE